MNRIIPITDPSLVLYLGNYALQEARGSIAIDKSRYGNHGTIHEARWKNFGNYGQALDFDGVDDSINMGNNPAWNLAATGATFEVWVKTPSVTDGWARIFDRFTGGVHAAGYNFYIRNITGRLGFAWITTGASNIILRPPLNYFDNLWHYVAVIVDVATKSGKMYVDGVEVRSDTFAGDLIDLDRDLWIGGAGIHNSWNGLIDEVRIYNRALSVEEIRQNMYNSWIYKMLRGIR